MIFLIDCCKKPFPQRRNKAKRLLRKHLGRQKIFYYHYTKLFYVPDKVKIVFVIAGYDPRSYLNRIELQWLLKSKQENCWFLNCEYMLTPLRSLESF